MDENMDLNKQDMNMNENQLNSSMEAVENMDMNKHVFKKDNELESDTEDVLHEFANPNAVIEEVTCKITYDSLFLLSKDERRMGTYVEKLKILLDEVKADMPNPASKNTGDVIGGERLKSEREKAIKVKAKAMKVCGYCQEKTNEHTKTICPNNPKTRKKKKVTPIIDV
ncbi:hypothetical protein Tco_0877130 [Tanacetum coccineum]|uniref:Protein FAR1-RELATED SEQUENCE n=1 Tax=Tanacetum coccineum TaxID=301880 RepID=A0ABQ5BW07_9ASTR